MRTRIALVAITSIALITVTILTQAVSVQPARAAARLPHRSTLSHRVRHRDRDQLTSVVSSRSRSTKGTSTSSGTTTTTLPTFAMGIDLLAGRRVGTKEVPPVVPPPVVAPAPVVTPVDTVTPYERSAWDRVAMCEEGGNWHADNSRFSGGLGITRANWDEYGGLQYASEGALATPDQQIMVAERIQSGAPDQDGCHGW
jgi:hypothetical protein